MINEKVQAKVKAKLTKLSEKFFETTQTSKEKEMKKDLKIKFSKDMWDEIKKLIALDTTWKKILWHSLATLLVLKFLTPLNYFIAAIGQNFYIPKPNGFIGQNIVIFHRRPIILMLTFILLGITNIIFYNYYLNKTSNADERKLPVDKEDNTEGSSWWMNRELQKEVFNVVKKEALKPDDGIVLAENKNGEYICMDWDNTNTSSSNRNFIVFGSPGTRKTSSIILNSIYCCMRKGTNIMLTDPKGELYKETIAAAKKYDYNIKVFNVRGNEFNNSCGWDCFRFIKESDTPVEDAATFARIVIDNTSSGKSNDFWQTSEYNLCLCLILYVAISPNFKTAKMICADVTNNIPNINIDKERTIASFYDILVKVDSNKLATIINSLGDDDPCKAPGLIWAANTQAQQVKSSLAIRLNILQSSNVQQILSTDEIRFEDLAKEKTICYVINSDQNTTFTLMTALFMSFGFISLARYADSLPAQKLDRPCYFIFEELYSVGKIPSFATKLSTFRSRNINVIICLQSLGQLKDIYSDVESGRYAWEIILNCCGVEICLGAGDETTQQHFQGILGDCTLKVANKRQTESMFNIFHIATSHDRTVASKKRQLMTNAELFAMSKTKIIIAIKSVEKAAYLYKCYYKNFEEAGYKIFNVNNDEEPLELKANTFYPVWRQIKDLEEYKNTSGNVDFKIPDAATLTPKLRKEAIDEENIKLISGGESYRIESSRKYNFKDKIKSIMYDLKTLEDEDFGDHDKHKGLDERDRSEESENTYNDVPQNVDINQNSQIINDSAYHFQNETNKTTISEENANISNNILHQFLSNNNGNREEEKELQQKKDAENNNIESFGSKCTNQTDIDDEDNDEDCIEKSCNEIEKVTITEKKVNSIKRNNKEVTNQDISSSIKNDNYNYQSEYGSDNSKDIVSVNLETGEILDSNDSKTVETKSIQTNNQKCMKVDDNILDLDCTNKNM